MDTPFTENKKLAELYDANVTGSETIGGRACMETGIARASGMLFNM